VEYTSAGSRRRLQILCEDLDGHQLDVVEGLKPERRGARDAAYVVLHDKPQKEWLDWMPSIPIPPAS